MFSYQALDTNASQVRLLDISAPTSHTGLISCVLRHVSLDTDPVPVFEAISYYWGGASERRDILLNGEIVSVPVNTELALRCMANGHRDRTVWIDALCINQTDNAERQQQVELMGRIYSSAQRTLVYLGERGMFSALIVDKNDGHCCADDLIDRAIDNISMLHKEIQSLLHEGQNFTNLVAPGVTFARGSSPSRTALDEAALLHFYGRPWFRSVCVLRIDDPL